MACLVLSEISERVIERGNIPRDRVAYKYFPSVTYGVATFTRTHQLFDSFLGLLGCRQYLSHLRQGKTKSNMVLHPVGVLIAPEFAALLQLTDDLETGIFKKDFSSGYVIDLAGLLQYNPIKEEDALFSTIRSFCDSFTVRLRLGIIIIRVIIL